MDAVEVRLARRLSATTAESGSRRIPWRGGRCRSARTRCRRAGASQLASIVPTEPVGAYITALEVEGFRGIGERARLELVPGPGLTLVIGRNGSGKSSFAEAFEVLLTGDNPRWAKRSAVWREGWKNLHHPTTEIAATLAVEGVVGETSVMRTWSSGAALEEVGSMSSHMAFRRRISGFSAGTTHCRCTGRSSRTASSGRCSTRGRRSSTMQFPPCSVWTS